MVAVQTSFIRGMRFSVVLLAILVPSCLRAADLRLADQTPVRLRLPSAVLFSNAKVGDVVQWEVSDDVKVGDVIVIRHGTPVRATVTTIFQVGTHPRLSMKLGSAELVTSQVVALQASPGYRIVNFSTDSPLNDIAVAKGTEVAAFTDGFLFVNINGAPSHPRNALGEITIGSAGAAPHRPTRKASQHKSLPSETVKGHEPANSARSATKGKISSVTNSAEEVLADTVKNLKPPDIDPSEPSPTLMAKVHRYVMTMAGLGILGTLAICGGMIFMILIGRWRSSKKA